MSITSAIKDVLKKTPLYTFYRTSRDRMSVRQWREEGCPAPTPQCVKYETIKKYGQESGAKVLVETGTFLGDAINANRKNYDQIYSIELGEDLHKKAQERFKNQSHIKLLQGDSGQVLPTVMDELDQPAVFWLDGHYSAGPTAKGDLETPIIAELDTILSHDVKSHVILIDDARCFDGTNDYPEMTVLEDYIQSKNPNLQIDVREDIIRVQAAA